MEKMHYKKLVQIIYDITINGEIPLKNITDDIKSMLSKDPTINWEIQENHFEWECFYLTLFLIIDFTHTQFSHHGIENYKKLSFAFRKLIDNPKAHPYTPIEKLARDFNAITHRLVEYSKVKREDLEIMKNGGEGLIFSNLCLAFTKNLIGRELDTNKQEGNTFILKLGLYIASLTENIHTVFDRNLGKIEITFQD